MRRKCLQGSRGSFNGLPIRVVRGLLFAVSIAGFGGATALVFGAAYLLFALSGALQEALLPFLPSSLANSPLALAGTIVGLSLAAASILCVAKKMARKLRLHLLLSPIELPSQGKNGSQVDLHLSDRELSLAGLAAAFEPLRGNGGAIEARRIELSIVQEEVFGYIGAGATTRRIRVLDKLSQLAVQERGVAFKFIVNAEYDNLDKLLGFLERGMEWRHSSSPRWSTFVVIDRCIIRCEIVDPNHRGRVNFFFNSAEVAERSAQGFLRDWEEATPAHVRIAELIEQRLLEGFPIDEAIRGRALEQVRSGYRS